MHRLALLTAAALSVLATGCATSPQQNDTVARTASAAATDVDYPDDRAVINFAQFRGSIRDWRAVGSEAILIEAAGGQWYRADFMGPCTQLPFAERVGFVTDTLNQIDRFSSIVVRHERCWFQSFREIPDPDAGTEEPE